MNGRRRRIRGESRITNRIEDIKEVEEMIGVKNNEAGKQLKESREGWKGEREREREIETEVSNCCREGAHGELTCCHALLDGGCERGIIARDEQRVTRTLGVDW